MKEKFEMVAKTFQGLENVLAEELKAIGAENVEIGRRMVSFDGDLEILYRANFCCRTALRILKPFYKFHANDADELYDAVKKFEWDKVLKIDQTFSIDSTVFSTEFRHSKFVTYRVKDAIADFFYDKYGKRPSIRLTNADFIFDVHISGNEITLSLDSSGESLHKRGYRVAQTEAPINEVLAAGIIMMTGWKGDTDFVDPMCGSGTFLIEAAMIATNTYPGIYRNSFAFERWSDFDSELFDSIYNDDSAEREFTHKIYGSDISPKAIAIAERNIKSASLSKYIELQTRSIQSITEAPEGGILITNPPYGERIEVEDMEALYQSIGERLKKVFRGYHAWIIGYKEELFACIGLKPSVKYPLLNGSLECELREYVIFDGSYSEFRKEGNSVKNEDFKKNEAKPEYRHRKFETTFKENDRDRGDRRSRFGSDKPKNALEEKYRRRPFGNDRRDRDDRKFERRDHDSRKFDRGDRKFDRDRDDRRPFGKSGKFGDGNEAPRQRERVHNEEFSNKVVRFRKPTLSAENERPIVKGRRNGWRRKGLDESNSTTPENNSPENNENK